MKKRVLLVDDDQVFNFVSTKMLEKIGSNEIHVASNGEQALQLINDYYSGIQIMPDVILLDLNMPVMDGFGFIEAFKHLNIPGKENIKIVIVSSSHNPNDRKHAKELGIEYYLEKPIKQKDLAAIMGEN